MDDKKPSLTSGSIRASIWHMSWPMLVIMFMNFFVGITDIYIAGLISPQVQAAVGFVGQISFLTIIIANAISIGGVVQISRSAGAGETEQSVETARQILILGFLVALALMIPGILVPGRIVALAGFPPEIRETAEKLLRVFTVAMGSNYLLIISNSIFRGAGEVKKPLITMTSVAVLNMALNFFLTFGVPPFPRLGYMGIAASSAIAVTAGTLMNLLFLKRGRWRAVYDGPWRISRRILGRTFSLSWPAALQQFAWNAGSLVLYNILGRLGEGSITALAAITNGFRIEAVIFLPAFALNMAASVLMGQNLGAGNPGRAEKLGWKTAMAAAGIMSVMAAPIFIFAGAMAGSFTDDPAVRGETVRYLRFNMLSVPFMALSVVLGGGLQGAGDTRGTLRIIFTAMWLIRLPLAYVFAVVLGYGATGAWGAMTASMIIQGSLMALRFRSGKWKRIRV